MLRYAAICHAPYAYRRHASLRIVFFSLFFAATIDVTEYADTLCHIVYIRRRLSSMLPFLRRLPLSSLMPPLMLLFAPAPMRLLQIDEDYATYILTPPCAMPLLMLRHAAAVDAICAAHDTEDAAQADAVAR